MDGKCLECHKDIAWLRDRNRGLHGRAQRSTCVSCHDDHKGVDFEPVIWKEGSPEKFDHTRAGWVLNGKHATLQCRNCHQPRYQVSGAAPLGKHSDPLRRWTGLESRCLACHKDEHRGSLGTECSGCHRETQWKPAPGFDHSKTAYPLVAKHAEVSCAKCHLASHLDLARNEEGQVIPKFKPLAHQECDACHRDPHDRRLGEQCSRCHATDTFHRVGKQAFDHDRTRFPLQGEHRPIACEKCHGTAAARVSRPDYSRCDKCHRDPHAGQATIAGRKEDCAACHEVKGWRPSSFTVAQHARSSYQLEGRHRQVACSSCHAKARPIGAAAAPAGGAVVIRPAHQQCADCHRDAHAGQLRSRKDGGRCESCHTPNGWKPSLFTAQDHRGLRLELTGRHLAAACSACHGPLRPGLAPLPGEEKLGTARVALKLDEKDCTDCHINPHAERFVTAGQKTARPCVDCHDTNTFRASLVDTKAHQAFSFKLEGAHRAVPCNACHDELAVRPASSSLLRSDAQRARLEFSTKRSRCADCHRTPHGDQFASRPGGDDCSACHSVDRFSPADRFDHTRDSRFPLKGGHARVACHKCHDAQAPPEGNSKAIVVFRRLSMLCESCHLGGPKGTLKASTGLSPSSLAGASGKKP